MSKIFRTVGHVTGVSLMLAPVALVGNSAFAAGSCQTTIPAATLVSAGICEVSFTEAGDFTFTAPSGIAKLQAVVVGGGSAAWSAANNLYGGGGGDVEFFDDVDVSTPIEIVVGAGGEYDSGVGEDSEINGDVVNGGDYSGISGNGNDWATDPVYVNFVAGGGAGGDAPSEALGGPGLKASEVAAGSDLFPASANELEFGAGGDSITAYNTTISSAPDVPGHGGNATVADTLSIAPDTILTGDDGRDGAVYLRWSPGLAATGVDADELALGAVSLIAGGAIVVASRRRAQRA
jgi:hypothetical protein